MPLGRGKGRGPSTATLAAMTASTPASNGTKVIAAIAPEEDKMALLMGRYGIDEQEQQAVQSKGNQGNACNRVGTREGTNSPWKATVSGQGPSAC